MLLHIFTLFKPLSEILLREILFQREPINVAILKALLEIIFQKE